MILVAGLIAIAVANEKIIAHPHERGTVKLSLLLVGGPILFLSAQGWYLRKVLNVRSRLHVIGVIVLVWVGLVTLVLPGYVALFFVGATLASMALFDRL
jgi:low temperature requirement protein LtrA